MKKKFLLLTAMVVLYGVCAGMLYAACNSEEDDVYELEASLSVSEALVPVGIPTNIVLTGSADGPSSYGEDYFANYFYEGTLYNDAGTVGSNTAEYGASVTLTDALDTSVIGTNTYRFVVVDIAHTNTDCRAEASADVVVVEIASATASNDVICYRNNSTVTGVPNPLPSFPPGNAVWTNLSANGSINSGTGATTIYTPSIPSTNSNDIKIKGECGTSSKSALITAVGVTGMTFVVGSETNVVLGFGEEGKAQALVSPDGRHLDWSYRSLTNGAETLLPRVLINGGETASAVPEDTPVIVTPAENSGNGCVMLRAVDTVTGCGWEKRIKVGCAGCSDCDQFANIKTSANGVNAEFSLGVIPGGNSAGSLQITASSMSPVLSTPSTASVTTPDGQVHSTNCLAHTAGSGSVTTPSAEYLTASGNDKLLRQVKVPDGLVDIVVSNDFRYNMVFYPESAVGPKGEDGYYTTNGSPKVTYIIENPDASTNIYNRLKITKVIGTDSNVSEYAYTEDGGTNRWQLSTGNGLKIETVTEYSADGYTNTLRTVTDASNTVLSAVLTKSMQYPWGRERLEQVNDPEGEALTTSWTYYTNSAEAGRYSRIAMQVNSDGSWQKSDYNASGYPSLQISGYKDTPTNATAAEARATYYDYSHHVGETPGDRPSTARTVIETMLGITNSINYRAYTTNEKGEREEISERAASATASYGDTNNLRSVSTYYAEDSALGKADRIKSVEMSDGRLTTYTYETGLFETNADPAQCTFTAGGTNDYLRTSVTHGTVSNTDGVSLKTTRDVTVEDPMGGTLMTETYVYNGSGYDRIRWSVNTLDETRRPVAVFNSDGTESKSTWACCGKESETDSTGIEMNVTDFFLIVFLVEF